MRRAIGNFIAFCGFIWIVVGMAPIFMSLNRVADSEASATVFGFSLILSSIAFLVPGGLVMAVGVLLARRGPSVVVVQQPPTPPAANLTDRLARLDGLLQSGAITTDEHARQRETILKSI